MIKIISEDGTLYRTRVIDTESGADLTKHISKIEIRANSQVRQMWEAVITIYRPYLEIKALGQLIMSERFDPMSGRQDVLKAEDLPACADCSATMMPLPNRTFKCPNCGATSGCS